MPQTTTTRNIFVYTIYRTSCYRQVTDKFRISEVSNEVALNIDQRGIWMGWATDLFVINNGSLSIYRVFTELNLESRLSMD